MKRRYFLALALSVATTALISGCGGGGGNGAPPDTTTLTGRVTLPAGISLTGVQVGSLLGTRAVNPDGTYTASVIGGVASLAMATGPGGAPLLLGFLRDGKTDLSARSTAEVLAFAALGTTSLPASVQQLYLEELSKPDKLTNLEKAVSDLIAAKGEAWMDSADATLKSALLQDIQAFQPTVTRGAIVTPTEKTSGITVETDGNGSTTVTNYFRRRAYFYAQRESYTDSERVEHPSFSILTDPAISLSPVKGSTSALPTIAEWLGGSRDFFAPVSADPISLPLTPSDARSTKYTLTAVGMGAADGDFSKLNPQQQLDYVDACLRSTVIDFIVPLVTGIIFPLKGELIDQWLGFVGSSGVLKDMIAMYAASPDIVTKIKGGQYKDAGYDMLQLLVGTESVKAALFKLLETFLKSAVGTVDATFMNKAAEKLNGLLGKIDLFLQTFDIIFQLMDLGRAQKATQWEVIVTKAKIQLTPDEVIVARGDVFPGIKVTAVDTTAPGGSAFAYAWKCSTGKISDGTNFAPVIESTNADSVTYAAGLTAGVQDTIEASVSIKGGGKTEPLGSAKINVYVTGVVVSPSTANLKAKETVQLKAEVQGMRTLKPSEKITYKWLTTRNAGELLGSDDGGTKIPVETQNATYKAHDTKEGVDTVTLEAYLGSKLLGSTTAKITVGSNTIQTTGRFYVDVKTTEPGRSSITAIMAIPKVEGGKRYDIYVHGINDKDYYGTEYRTAFTIPGLPPGWVDEGTEYAVGLAGGTGEDNGIPSGVAYYTNRFAGIIIDVTVTL
ncbi:MAG: L,D-transpeptidase [Armatimonas sp.]